MAKTVDPFDALVKEMGGGRILVNKEYVTTGILALDFMLTGYGFRQGSIAEMYGRWSTGKTVLAMHILANVQRQGFTPVLLDAESAFDDVLAKSVGMDMSNFIYFPLPEAECLTIESTFDIIQKLLTDTDRKFIFAVDSLAALETKDQVENPWEGRAAQHTASTAKRGLRSVRNHIIRSKSVLLVLNQVFKDSLGYDSQSPGGNAIKHFIDYRIQFSTDRRKNSFICKMTTKKNRHLQYPVTIHVEIPYQKSVDERSGFEKLLLDEKVVRDNELISDVGKIRKAWLAKKDYTGALIASEEEEEE
ncbi:MAG TPA: hypothetical protein DHN29_12940 [Cytophagales bacterium]|nr:hypothetical protein [Cytophagales bacterium]|tara:strand:- start:1080 stop:1991 length:912 start_codon:yes stop_codon:yes gene_type:complete